MFSFRGALGRLTSIATTAINDKTLTSSHEDLVTGAASDNAAAGVYRLKVERLATAHQLSTATFASPDTIISEGELEIRVGGENAVTVRVDSANNTAQGLVDAINASDADVSATIINNGTGGSDSYQILLTANKTGEVNEISIVNNLAAPTGSELRPEFNVEVDAPLDAQVTFGSGANPITVFSSDNQLDELIAGVTLNLNQADAEQEITLNVTQDVESARTAVEGFVAAYNDLITNFNDQLRFNSETLEGGPLLGESAVVAIQNEVQQTLSSVVGGLEGELNRLSALGISVSNSGTLDINSSRLEAALKGNIDGVSTQDVARLFALGGTSSTGAFRFVTGSTSTAEGVVEVDITSAARKATVVGTSTVPASVSITDANNTFSLSVDGKQSSQLTLRNGDYTPEELATEIETVINGDDELGGRDVAVTIDNGQLRITTKSIGSSSKIEDFDGKVFQTLGLEGASGRGQDVVGRFIVNGEVETATGTGDLLRGDDENEFTADLQIRVNITDSQIVDGPEGTLTVTRGIAARLDEVIGDFLDSEDGRLKTVNDRFNEQLEGIQESIDRFNERFESERESLIRQFAALESAVADLQTTGNFLTQLLPR